GRAADRLRRGCPGHRHRCGNPRQPVPSPPPHHHPGAAKPGAASRAARSAPPWPVRPRPADPQAAAPPGADPPGPTAAEQSLALGQRRLLPLHLAPTTARLRRRAGRPARPAPPATQALPPGRLCAGDPDRHRRGCLALRQRPALQPVESATESLRHDMNLKQAVKAGAGWCYLLNPLSRRLQAEGVILMLHRVVADDREAALPHRRELCTGSQAFERLLRGLRSHFECVPLMGLLDPHTAPSERLRVALTFDDGWRDNASHAFPLLKRYNMPASIFLSTDFIGTRRHFWWESIGETLWGKHGAAARDALWQRLDEMGTVPPAAIREERQTLVRSNA